MAPTDGPRGWIAGWERFFDCFVDFRRRSWLGLGSAFVRVVEARQDLALVDAEETFLIRSDLVHVDVVVTRVDEFLDETGQITVQPGHRVVTGGPSRYVRQPSYSGIAPVLAGIALACDDVWSLLAVAVSAERA